MDNSLILLVWTTSLLMLLWQTNSLRTSISTTVMAVSMFGISVMYRIYGEIGCLFILIGVLSILVARVIPHDTHDKWTRDDSCC